MRFEDQWFFLVLRLCVANVCGSSNGSSWILLESLSSPSVCQPEFYPNTQPAGGPDVLVQHL